MIRPEDRRMILPWALLILAPVLVCVFGIQFIPEGVTRIPTHWDFSGNINGWGAPSDLMVLGYIMAATNALLAFCYFGYDVMDKHGLVNSPSRRFGRITLVVSGAVLVVLTAVIQYVSISSVLSNL